MKRLFATALIFLNIFAFTVVNAEESMINKINSIYTNNPSDIVKLEKVNSEISLLKKDSKTYREDKIRLVISKIFLTIWLNLNHQKPEIANKLYDAYASNENFVNSVAKYGQYNDFSTLLQLKKFYSQASTEEIEKLYNLRLQYFPEEKNHAHNQVILINWYSNLDCSNLTVGSASDSIDIVLCKIQHYEYSEADLETINNLPIDQQTLSDQINFYGQLIIYGLEPEEKMYALQKNKAFMLLKLDKEHVNAYLPLLQNVYRNDCKNFNIVYKQLIKYNSDMTSDGIRRSIKEIQPTIDKCTK